MTLVKPAQASGDLVTPPSLQYFVTNWHTYYYGNFTDTALSCSAPTVEGLKPCVEGAARMSVSYNRNYNVYNGGTGPWGYTDVVASRMGCPEHAQITGTTICTCNNPTATDPINYVPDTAATSCIPESLTIALFGLGGVVMPTRTQDAYAKVTRNDGSAKSGAQVILSLNVIPEDDGYNHAVGQHTVPHEGSLSTLGGSTGADGRLNFRFTAPMAGGEHIITAGCVGCTNVEQGTITVPGCPVDELTEIEKLSELYGETQEQTALTKMLDEGMDGYSLLTPATQAAEQCLARRVGEVVGLPSTSGYKVTSTIRTYAYQKHLRNVWDKFIELQDKIDNDPTIQQRCQILITKVEGEMGFRLTQDPTDEDERCNPALGRAHCVRYPPATNDPKHVVKIAFDIPLPTVKAFERRLRRPPPSTVQQEANACGLNWGGTFSPPDRIHFLLR